MTANSPTAFTSKWDYPQLTEDELNSFSGNCFEWWYFDFSCEDGTQGVIIFSFRNPIFCSQKISLLLQLTSPQKKALRIRNYPASAFHMAIEGQAMNLEFGEGNKLSMDGTSEQVRWRLTFNIDGITGDLTVKPLHQGFLPAADGKYIKEVKGSRYSAVSFSAPATFVQGSLQYDGDSHAIRGTGYHDHPWGTAQLVSTHHQWSWVRAKKESDAIMFAKVMPQSEFSGGLDFMYIGRKNEFKPRVSGQLQITCSEWKKAHWYGVRFPHELKAASEDEVFFVSTSESLLDLPIYNRSEIQLRTMKTDDATGSGWVEYFKVNPWLRGPILIGGKIATFFLRRFPFIGQ